jgi:hypothetical protein
MLDGFELCTYFANGGLREHVALALDRRSIGQRRLLLRMLSRLRRVDDAATHKRGSSDRWVVEFPARLDPALGQRLRPGLARICPALQEVFLAL